ncbi:hypothetical protein [Kitasatospora sp. GP82]|nr:hypothetical protein [Kitasatospora sp. GP82]MDH6129383.1 hypothetical protein [Kitasatospora sp. GP82]
MITEIPQYLLHAVLVVLFLSAAVAYGVLLSALIVRFLDRQVTG